MSQINAPFQLSLLQSIVTAIIAGLFMVPLETPAPADFLPMLPQLAFAGTLPAAGRHGGEAEHSSLRGHARGAGGTVPCAFPQCAPLLPGSEPQ